MFGWKKVLEIYWFWGDSYAAQRSLRNMWVESIPLTSMFFYLERLGLGVYIKNIFMYLNHCF